MAACLLILMLQVSFCGHDQEAVCTQIAVLDALAQLGCDPSVKDSVSSTPMHVAAGEGHIQAILKLIELVRHRHASACSLYSCHCTSRML